MRFEKAPGPETVTFTVTATLKELRKLANEFCEFDYENFERRFPASYALLENFPTEFDNVPFEFSLDD